MRHLLGVLLLLAQLGPFVGAGLCMHAKAEPRPACPMPMPGTPSQDENAQPASSPDCALMAICAPSVPMVPAAAALLTASTLPGHTTFSTPATLVPGDPIVPPLPPPIA